MTRKEIIKKLDLLVGKYVRLRDKNCISCGKQSYLQAGHFTGRSNNALRFDLSNVNGQCVHCNMVQRNSKVVKLDYENALIEKIGIEEVERLKNTKSQKLPLSELKNLYICINTIYKALKNEKNSNNRAVNF